MSLNGTTIAQIKGLVISQALTGIISMRFLMCISNGVCILPVNRSITTLYSGGGDMVIIPGPRIQLSGNIGANPENIHPSASVDISGCRISTISKICEISKKSCVLFIVLILTQVYSLCRIYFVNFLPPKREKYEESFKDWLSCSDTGAVVRL